MTSPTRKIAVVGLGYVGLPVAVSMANAGYATIGFDISKRRIEELSRGEDATREIEREILINASIQFTDNVEVLREADFFIIAVPTPIDDARRPDMRALLGASKTVANALKKGDVVVYESTVYPGATEEDCIPVLEKISGLSLGKDFGVGYSPERINPGDKERRFETICKVVSGSDEVTLEIAASVYGSVVTAGIHRAASIKVAEAAKVIENSQRDLNIAFMNELAMIFRLLDLDTNDVLAAAATKWNFLRFSPGLVGGHCIGVDPYYLTHRAEREGYHPQVILAGRRINDEMSTYVARECVRLLLRSGSPSRRVTILGLTFKEDVPDIRNSKIIDVARELLAHGLEIQMVDPFADPDETFHEYGIRPVLLSEVKPADAVILAVAHVPFKEQGWRLIQECLGLEGKIVLDIKSCLDRADMPLGLTLWRL
jgi:UDP-N-acetyl-D-galactosamine dehydrogenase